MTRLLMCLFVAVLAGSGSQALAATAVTPLRVPDAGLQPQVSAGPDGVVHLVYLKGDPAASDVFYASSKDGGATWSKSIPVNSQPGSAIAMGTVRGAHVAIGTNGRVHVAWMGAKTATPRGPGDGTPMLYTRLADTGDRFEPQRNVIAERPGLDGGGSVAADDRGHVYVAWHAPPAKGAGEAARAVWLAESADDGKTFAKEVRFSPDDTGVCGCCGMGIVATPTGVFALYRSASEVVHRDLFLVSRVGKAEPSSRKLAEVTLGACPMSTTALTPTPEGVAAAWETDKQIQWTLLPAKPTAGDAKSGPFTIPGTARTGRRFPAIVTNGKGEVLVAWAEGTGWQKGGTVVWQLFNAKGEPLADPARAENLPAWSLPAVFVKADGGFVVLY